MLSPSALLSRLPRRSITSTTGHPDIPPHMPQLPNWLVPIGVDNQLVMCSSWPRLASNKSAKNYVYVPCVILFSHLLGRPLSCHIFLQNSIGKGNEHLTSSCERQFDTEIAYVVG